MQSHPTTKEPLCQALFMRQLIPMSMSAAVLALDLWVGARMIAYAKGGSEHYTALSTSALALQATALTGIIAWPMARLSMRNLTHTMNEIDDESGQAVQARDENCKVEDLLCCALLLILSGLSSLIFCLLSCFCYPLACCLQLTEGFINKAAKIISAVIWPLLIVESTSAIMNVALNPDELEPTMGAMTLGMLLTCIPTGCLMKGYLSVVETWEEGMRSRRYAHIQPVEDNISRSMQYSMSRLHQPPAATAPPAGYPHRSRDEGEQDNQGPGAVYPVIKEAYPTSYSPV